MDYTVGQLIVLIYGILTLSALLALVWFWAKNVYVFLKMQNVLLFYSLFNQQFDYFFIHCNK